VINTVAAMAVVASLAGFWLRNRDSNWQTVTSGILLASSLALGAVLLLGSAYMASHAWLVARGLMKPAPRLEEMLSES
jgi:ABC-type Mn2+/Zn2+ transport system permease subunit